MERLPYHTKRAHWKMTYEAIDLFVRFGIEWGKPALQVMTPARLDILHLIDQRLAWSEVPPGHRPSMSLGEIIRKLGLHPSTISKCVARMAELGLVTRSRADDDQRRTIVTLTAMGLEGIGAAFRVLEHLRAELRQVSERLGTRLATLAERARRCARFYGSRAVDLWHPSYVDTG